VLAGYPMVDIEVELFDGSYHEVDSNEMAFKIAGSIGFKEGAQRAGPNPAGADHGHRGDHAEPFSGKRDRRPVRPAGKNPPHGAPCGNAGSSPRHVPLAEMFGYSTSLRSATEGRAIYTMQFHHYAPVAGAHRGDPWFKR